MGELLKFEKSYNPQIAFEKIYEISKKMIGKYIAYDFTDLWAKILFSNFNKPYMVWVFPLTPNPGLKLSVS